jgi:hypothetical protein
MHILRKGPNKEKGKSGIVRKRGLRNGNSMLSTPSLKGTHVHEYHKP